jgi:nuclear pore complex protein Nup205
MPDMIESLLLLIWRHLLFYANDANPDPIRPDNLSISLAGGSLADASRLSSGQRRPLRNVAADLRGTLERLKDIKEVSCMVWTIAKGSEQQPDDLRRGGERNDAYYSMLLRRLNELTAGLSGEEA